MASDKCPMNLPANYGANPSESICADDMSLYEQFGGDARMRIFVEEFMEGIMGDSELACYHQ